MVILHHHHRANWIKVDGCLYKPNCVVVLSVNDGYPVFGLTKALFVADLGQIYLTVTKLTTKEFNEHRHLYLVQRTSETVCVAQNSLYTPLPLHCRRAIIDGHTCMSVVVKHHILGTVQA